MDKPITIHLSEAQTIDMLSDQGASFVALIDGEKKRVIVAVPHTILARLRKSGVINRRSVKNDQDRRLSQRKRAR